VEKWFFMTADYAFGYALGKTPRSRQGKGGRWWLGPHSLELLRFLRSVLQAHSSKAKIIGLAMPVSTHQLDQEASGIRHLSGQKLAGLLLTWLSHPRS